MTEQQPEQEGTEAPYIDPNSGAAPQPGGVSSPVAATDESQQAEGEEAEEAEEDEEPAEAYEEEEEEEEEFDPAAYTVQDVLAYVEENPDQRQRILQQERAGENRSSLVSRLERG